MPGTDKQDRKTHWESVYATKQPNEVSWTQEYPKSSLDLIQSFGVSKSASVIDVGGGDSRLVDCLLDEGFQHITVLDISSHAIERAKQRLGANADRVHWIVSDILDFEPTQTYDIWHDRAAFHFLTDPTEIAKYVELLNRCCTHFAAIATFSEHGPAKCSGLEVTRYSEELLQLRLHPNFRKLGCTEEEHMTPFGTKQMFLFCGFERIA